MCSGLLGGGGNLLGLAQGEQEQQLGKISLARQRCPLQGPNGRAAAEGHTQVLVWPHFLAGGPWARSVPTTLCLSFPIIFLMGIITTKGCGRVK